MNGLHRSVIPPGSAGSLPPCLGPSVSAGSSKVSTARPGRTRPVAKCFRSSRRCGMNAYVYAPKDDPFHRTRWREPYPSDEQAALGALAAHCRELGVRFGFAISPGLDIAYESDADRKQLDAKLAPLIDAGVDWFVLALDDIPAAPGLARRQADARDLAPRPRRASELTGAAITVCPTEYVGTRPSPYLAELARGLPATSRCCGPARRCARRRSRSPTRASWTAAVAPHDVLLWDNYPVNDGTHDARACTSVRTTAATPGSPTCSTVCSSTRWRSRTRRSSRSRPRPGSSPIPTATTRGEAWAARPSTTSAASTRRRSPCARRGVRRRSAALPRRPRARAPRRRARRADRRARTGSAPARAVGAVLRDARAISRPRCAEATAGALGAEVAPWAAAAAREATAGLAALRLLQRSRPVALVDDDGHGRAAAPDAELLLEAVFGLVFSWSGARANTEVDVRAPVRDLSRRRADRARVGPRSTSSSR